MNEAIEKLKELQDDYDTETAHIKADCILCELLRSLGFDQIVDEYEKIDKWYA